MVLAADHPQSVRHIFYRLTDPTGPVSVPKTEHGYNLIIRECAKMRRVSRACPAHFVAASDDIAAGYRRHERRTPRR